MIKLLITFLLTICFTLSLFAQQTSPADGDAARLTSTLLQLNPPTTQSGELTTISAGDEVEGDFIGEMQFTRNGEQLWVLHRVTNNISVFDWTTQTIVQNIEVGAMPIGLAFSDTYAVVPCYTDNEVYVIDLADYSIAAVLPSANQPAKVAVSRDGSIAAVGCDEPDVAEIYNLNTLEKVNTIPDFPVYLYTFSFITSNTRSSVFFSGFTITPDNNYLVNGAGDDALHVYNISTGEKETSLPEGADCGQLTLSGDGHRIVALRDGNAAVAFQLDVATHSITSQVELPDVPVFAHYSAPAVNLDGSKMLFAAGGDYDVVLVDFTAESFTPINTGNTPDWVGQSADYQYAIAADFYLAVIDFASGDIVSDLDGISIQNAAVSPASNHLVATDPLRYESLNFYDFGDPAGIEWIGERATGSVLEADATYSVKFTPDKTKLVALNSLSGTLSIIDVASESLEQIVPLGSAETFHVDITSDNRFALVAKRLENSVAIIDLQSGELVEDVPSGGNKPDQVFILPNDAYAYAVNAGAPDRIGVIALDGANSSLESTFSIGNTGISWTNYGLRSDLVFHPSGDYALLANPFDDAVQIIDLANHSIVDVIPVSGFPLQLAVAPDDDFGAFVGVTLKNESAIAVLAVPGNNGSLVDTYTGSGNPTRIAYDPATQQFGVTFNDDGSVRSFAIDGLFFADQDNYSFHTPIAVQYSGGGRRFVLLRSDDSSVQPHQLEVDGTLYDLPSLPMHNFAVTSDGMLAAIPLIATDEVVLFQEGPLGFRTVRIALQSDLYEIFPNPAKEQLHFNPVEGAKLPANPTLRLLDQGGSVLYDREITGKAAFRVDRQSHWPAGLYIVEIREEGKLRQWRKVVLK